MPRKTCFNLGKVHILSVDQDLADIALVAVFLGGLDCDLLSKRELRKVLSGDITKRLRLFGASSYSKSAIFLYELECVNFMRHEFPQERKASVH